MSPKDKSILLFEALGYRFAIRSSEVMTYGNLRKLLLSSDAAISSAKNQKELKTLVEQIPHLALTSLNRLWLADGIKLNDEKQTLLIVDEAVGELNIDNLAGVHRAKIEPSKELGFVSEVYVIGTWSVLLVEPLKLLDTIIPE